MVVAGAAAVAVGCGKQAAPAGPAPDLLIQDRDEISFPSGTRITTWRLRGTGVRRLTARLVVFADGHLAGRTQIDCTWRTPGGPVVGHLTLLAEDGRAFGAAAKSVHTLGLTFPVGGPTTKGEHRAEPAAVPMPGGGASMASGPGSVSAREVVYAEVRGPAAERAFARPIESDAALAGQSAGGVALAIIVEWEP